jgi:hypothetical protein
MPDTVELRETAPHGKGAGRTFGLAGAFPTAETRDDPGGPGDGLWGMGIFLPLGASFILELKGGEEFDLDGFEEVASASDTWPSRARTSRMTRHAVRAVTIASFIRASCVVESRQRIGFSPGGASYSQTSTPRSVTCGGATRTLRLAGRAIVTSPKRNSSLAVRALRLPNWAFNVSRKR